MTASTSQSQALFARAHAVIPGGVNSPVRAFGAVGGTPPFIASGQGPYITDVDGNTYVDLVCAWGPMILGHRHPAVAAAIADTASRGWSYGAPTGVEVELATEIAARVRPVEQVRLVSSGTEATMTAVRLARAATGRNKILKFEGCYHGHGDAFLVAAGSGVATLGLPDSPGVPTGVSADTIVVPYNSPDAVREAFAQHGEQIACVITEACPANMGVVPPAPGFNAFLREICTAHGALLVVDEVLTGFRVSSAGWYGLEAVDADLMTFGKVIGGGLPAAAIGGRADLMGLLAPLGPVYQAGTLSGNPLACAAGLATLGHLDAAAYATADAASTLLRQALTGELSAAGVPHRIQTGGSLFSLFFTDQPVTTYAEARQQDRAIYRAFFHAMLERGVYLPPSPLEAWMVSAVLDSTALARVLSALPAAAQAAAAAATHRHLPGMPPAVMRPATPAPAALVPSTPGPGGSHAAH